MFRKTFLDADFLGSDGDQRSDNRFSDNLPLKVYYIKKDDQFWKSKIEEKVTSFYMDCLLPELVDPRISRSMEIREPSYIIEAIEKRNARKISVIE